MKASEICDFFEFDIQRFENVDISYFYDKMFAWGVDEEDTKSFTGFEVSDLQNCFRSRYITDIKDLIECFDSMLTDYIFDPFQDCLDEMGVSGQIDLEVEVDTMEDILTVLNTHSNVKEHVGEGFYDLIASFVNPDLIEDDVTPQKLEKKSESIDR